MNREMQQIVNDLQHKGRSETGNIELLKEIRRL